MASICKPVAVTITSASISAPPRRLTPRSVNVWTWSVTIDARPALTAANRSPSGTTHRRWSHGL